MTGRLDVRKLSGMNARGNAESKLKTEADIFMINRSTMAPSNILNLSVGTLDVEISARTPRHQTQ